MTARRCRWSGAPTSTCTVTDPWSGSTIGAWRVSSSRRSQPASSAARSASSTKAVPGTITVSKTPWSVSQGWACRDSSPDSSTSSDSATGSAALSIG